MTEPTGRWFVTFYLRGGNNMTVYFAEQKTAVAIGEQWSNYQKSKLIPRNLSEAMNPPLIVSAFVGGTGWGVVLEEAVAVMTAPESIDDRSDYSKFLQDQSKLTKKLLKDMEEEDKFKTDDEDEDERWIREH